MTGRSLLLERLIPEVLRDAGLSCNSLTEHVRTRDVLIAGDDGEEEGDDDDETDGAGDRTRDVLSAGDDGEEDGDDDDETDGAGDGGEKRKSKKKSK